MGQRSNRQVYFDPNDQHRLLAVVRDLGTSYSEFIVFAVHQALDEYEGYARDDRLRHEYYARLNGHSNGHAPPIYTGQQVPKG